MRKRQLESFRQADCLAMCTVEGMLKAHSVGSNGDITPVHMCELLQEVGILQLEPVITFNSSHATIARGKYTTIGLK